MDSRLNYELARMQMAELEREVPIHGRARQARAAAKKETPSRWRRFRDARSEPVAADSAVAPLPVATPAGAEERL